MSKEMRIFLLGLVFLIFGLLGIWHIMAQGGKHKGHPTPTPTSTATPSPVPVPTITLAWDAELDPSVNGYHLWMGFVSGQETKEIDAGKATTWTLQLTSGTTYYFVVTAYNTAGDSLPSNEVSYTTP